MAQKILFATNRAQQGLKDGRPNFVGASIGDGAKIQCAAATVSGISTTDQDSGHVDAVTAPSNGSFAAADLADLLASKNDVLVFVHGADNSFEDAITRAAYNQAWLAEQVLPQGSGRFDLIAFTWPGISYDLAGILAPFVGVEDYEHDREQASGSDVFVGQFLDLLTALKPQLGTRRLNLLCHSMGNYALGGGIEAWSKGRALPAAPLFDEIVLAAADEISTTFTQPGGGRLSNLAKIGREITVYFNHNDIAMHLSRVVNGEFHLGYDGPPDRANIRTFPQKIFEFVDCDGLTDYLSDQADRTHQYYRESKRVRLDIATTLAGGIPVRNYFYANENFHAFAKIDLSGRG